MDDENRAERHLGLHPEHHPMTTAADAVVAAGRSVHDSQLAPGSVAIREDDHAADLDAPGVWAHQADDLVDQGGLARAVVSQESHDLPGRDVQIDAVVRLDATASSVALAQLRDAQHIGSHILTFHTDKYVANGTPNTEGYQPVGMCGLS